MSENEKTEKEESIELDVNVEGVMTSVHNLANIYLRTGNHEVRVVISEVAKALCHLIGIEHKVFFPEPPKPGEYRPVQPSVQSWGAPQGPGLHVPGMPPSPYAGIPTTNIQNTDPNWAPDPGNPVGAKMILVDPGNSAQQPPQQSAPAPAFESVWRAPAR